MSSERLVYRQDRRIEWWFWDQFPFDPFNRTLALERAVSCICLTLFIAQDAVRPRVFS